MTFHNRVKAIFAPGWAIRALALFALAAFSSGAWAASISLTVKDTAGNPVPDAIVSVAPLQAGGIAVVGAPATPSKVVINQRDETFIPYDIAVRRGGTVTFQNSDQTRHHVYSFAPIKQFEFIVTPGETSAPVEFDVVGVAAIGCNIHDQMIAYVYVTDAPWSVVTREDGAAKFDDLPAGDYIVTIWHPRLKTGSKAPTQTVALPTQQARLALTMAVLPPPLKSDDDMNMY